MDPDIPSRPNTSCIKYEEAIWRGMKEWKHRLANRDWKPPVIKATPAAIHQGCLMLTCSFKSSCQGTNGNFPQSSWIMDVSCTKRSTAFWGTRRAWSPRLGCNKVGSDQSNFYHTKWSHCPHSNAKESWLDSPEAFLDWFFWSKGTHISDRPSPSMCPCVPTVGCSPT